MKEEKPAVSLPKVMVGRVEMRTPDDVSAMLALKSCGWGTKRIAAELGCSRNTVKRWLAEGGWRSASPPSRARALEGFEVWLAERFRRHGGNADVVRQEQRFPVCESPTCRISWRGMPLPPVCFTRFWMAISPIQGNSSILWPSNRLVSPRLRVFMDHMTEALFPDA